MADISLRMAISIHRGLAPVPYSEVAKGIHLARAIGGALIAVFGVITTFGDVNVSSTTLVLAGSVVATHAVARLRNPTSSPFGTVFMDTSLIAAMVLFAGQPDIPSGAGFAYALTAAALLLPPRRSGIILAYSAAWAALIVAFAPLSDPAVAVGASLTFSTTTTVLVLAIVLLLLAAVAVTLLGSRARHETALDRERDAVKLKNEFVSMVSHELRTPLTSIAGFTETLIQDWRSLDDDSVDEFLGIIGNEVRNLSHLVEDILVIPRIEAGRLKLDTTVFELRPMCHAIVDVLATETNKDLEVSMPAGIMVEADFMRLQQVIRNLVVNAIKYGGDQILIQGINEGDTLQAVVSDNGPGIPEEDRGRIFDRFEQGSSGDAREASGVGLGLPIARKLMRAMDGDLWFEPRFPTGANFFFSMKMAARTAAPSETLINK